jgi:hypothetical protein
VREGIAVANAVGGFGVSVVEGFFRVCLCGDVLLM